MQVLKLLTFIGVLFLVVSCGKDDEGDVTAPVISITSPADGTVLERGKTYPVQGTVTDDTELAEIDAAGVKITTFDTKTKHTFANLNLPIEANTPVNSGINVTITAKDKSGNVATKVLKYTVK